VVYVGGSDSGGTLYAVRESDGAVLWTQPVSNGDNSSPALNATDVFVSYACGLVYAFDQVTGEQVGTFQSDRAPAFADKTGLFLSGSTLRAMIGRRTVWSFTGDGGLVTAPIVVGSTVFVGSSSGMLYGLDLRRGGVVWSTNVGASILAPDEQNVSQPHTGLGAGQGLLVVPAGTRLVAYGR
jgi:outer membrane protein assembly factor BamB